MEVTDFTHFQSLSPDIDCAAKSASCLMACANEPFGFELCFLSRTFLRQRHKPLEFQSAAVYMDSPPSTGYAGALRWPLSTSHNRSSADAFTISVKSGQLPPRTVCGCDLNGGRHKLNFVLKLKKEKNPLFLGQPLLALAICSPLSS